MIKNDCMCLHFLQLQETYMNQVCLELVNLISLIDNNGFLGSSFLIALYLKWEIRYAVQGINEREGDKQKTSTANFGINEREEDKQKNKYSELRRRLFTKREMVIVTKKNVFLYELSTES